MSASIVTTRYLYRRVKGRLDSSDKDIQSSCEKVKGENQGISKFEYFGIFVVIPFICIVTQFILFPIFL